MNNESFAHITAKHLIATWLRKTAENAGDTWVDFCGINWRVNRGGPNFGVFEEYPIVEAMAFVWDETEAFFQRDEWPDYSWMKAHSMGNFKIADIAIQHKGVIAYIIEIVHKNHVSDAKVAFYKRLPFSPTIVAIPAHWILGQIGIPSDIPNEFFL